MPENIGYPANIFDQTVPEFTGRERLFMRASALNPRLQATSNAIRQERSNKEARLQQLQLEAIKFQLQNFNGLDDDTKQQVIANAKKMGFLPESATGFSPDPGESTVSKIQEQRAQLEREAAALSEQGRAIPASLTRNIDELSAEIERKNAPAKGLTIDFGGGGRFGPKSRTEAANINQQRRQSINTVESIGNLLTEIHDIGPGATGLRGALTREAGGLLGQVSPNAADRFGQIISGATPAEVRNVQTRAQALVANLIPTITGDDSGRYTDTEQRIAKETQATLAKNPGPAEVFAALETLMQIELETQFRNDILTDGSSPFDVTTEKGQLEMIREYINLGLPPEAAADVVNRNKNFFSRKYLGQ